MDSRHMSAELDSGLRAIESLGRVVSAEHLAELQGDIREKYDTGRLSKSVVDSYMRNFEYEIPEDLPRAGSVVIVATRQPHYRLTFHANGVPRSFIVPTNYAHGTDDIVKGTLEDLLGNRGFNIRRAHLPLKLLAVRSGLASYGKNNIAYIDGMGSYFRLTAFYTDFPFEEDNWGNITMADRCKDCTTCEKKCPTGAIGPDRFLIRAEQCLTFFNESKDDIPAAIDPSIHSCLIGCLYCQKFCPLNRQFDDYIVDGPVFSKDETDRILNGKSDDSVAPEIRAKLDRPGLHYDVKIVARNLRLLMDNN